MLTWLVVAALLSAFFFIFIGFKLLIEIDKGENRGLFLILFGVILFMLVLSYSRQKHLEVKEEQEYSLWLTPSGPDYDALQRLTCDLADLYPSHCFMPHVTVVGEVKGSLDDVRLRANALAKRTKALEARFTAIEWTPGDFYRSFYLLVNETAAFSKLYEDTCEIMRKCHKRPYHMSIMYTELLDPEKIAIRDSLYKALNLDWTVSLDRLWICSTTGLPPEKWSCPIGFTLN